MTEPTPAAPVAGRTSDALDRSLISGLAWTGAAKWTTQVLSWASTLVVARLLTPSDYGIMGMALVYLGLVQLVSEFGLGAALIQRRDLDESQIAGLGGFSIAVGAALCLLSMAVAPLVAGFFHEPAVTLVLVVLSVSFVITGLQVVPNSLLARDLTFRRLAVIEGVEALTVTCLTLALAIAGSGYWALVLGGIGGKVVSTTLLLNARPHRVAWPRQFARLRGALTFGWRVVLTRLSWYLYSNADFMIIGRLLGKALLGAYTFGWTTASIPVDKITAVIGRVTMPVLAAVQHDRAAVARYLLLLSEGLALIVLPASLGLALVAPDFVAVFLGDHWAGAVFPLRILAMHVLFRCINSLFSQALLALDETTQSLRVGVVQLLVLPAAFAWAAVHWGINGVALTWLIVHPLITIPMLLMFTMRRVDLTPGRLLRGLWPALSSTAVMVGGVEGVKLLLAGSPAPLRLAAAVTAGAATYPGALALFHRARILSLMASLKALRQ